MIEEDHPSIFYRTRVAEDGTYERYRVDTVEGGLPEVVHEHVFPYATLALKPKIIQLKSWLLEDF